jgi:two-component system nitrate/nitrite response regulator NarL
MQTTSAETFPRVLLAEDDAIIRFALRQLVKAHCSVVAETADGQEAVDLTSELNPDIVLMDVGMPGLSGLDAAHLIKTRMPEVRILMLSSYSDSWHINEAFRMGADGYVLKGSACVQLPQAIKYVLGGGTFRPAIG